MFKKYFSQHKNFLLYSILAGTIVAIFAIAPQIDLWITRGAEWNGVFASSDFDESFYAAYLESLIDGKPRRNSPYSGAVDSPETPQNESGLSIQFLASYPFVIFAQIFNLSISNLMIFMSLIIGFFSAFVIFWLIYLFTKDEVLSFAITLIVIFGGGMAAGQGSIFYFISSKQVHYIQSLIFMRRFVPAVGFPGFFLFFVFIWKYFNASTSFTRLTSAVLAIISFTFCVYSYYYFWTTALAWFFTLLILWTLFKFKQVKENIFSVLGICVSLFLVLIPYVLLLSNRAKEIDSVIVLQTTHQPDLFRIPQILCYFAVALFILFKQFGWIEWKDPKIIFLLSFNLVVPVLFNQQVITGRTIQPYHYEFFCANYLVLISLFTLIFIVLKQKMNDTGFKRTLLYVSAIPIMIGGVDNICAANLVRDSNVWRDQLLPVAEKIKVNNQHSKLNSANPLSFVLSYDLSEIKYLNSTDIPALASQPVLWAPHIRLHPDINSTENENRLYKFLYYQNVDKEVFRTYLNTGSKFISMGVFGGERFSDIYTGEIYPLTTEEIDNVVEQYEQVSKNFSYQDAQTHLISNVIANIKVNNDFTNLDRWYQRDSGEIIGDYILYQVKLRQP